MHAQLSPLLSIFQGNVGLNLRSQVQNIDTLFSPSHNLYLYINCTFSTAEQKREEKMGEGGGRAKEKPRREKGC